MLAVVFAVIFAVSTFFVLSHFYQEQKSRALYDGLAEAVTEQSAAAADHIEKESPSEQVQIPAEKKILPEYEPLYQENSDMVGWISVPGTQINYPVVQTPDNPNYYLHRDFYGKDAACGCLYVQENCDVKTPSDNIIIYGHNMRNGSMFGELDRFESKAFWEDHRTLSFDTLTDRQEYEIIAVLKTFIDNSPEAFPYYRFVDAENRDEFDDFLHRCKELSLYETGIGAEYGDRLITLSTCEYTHADGRLVLVARQISRLP